MTHPQRDAALAPVRARAVLSALVFASAASLAMLAVRRMWSGQSAYRFLIWNLILAWIPLISSLATYRLYHRNPRRLGIFITCALVWFFFFPNAPYILTDLIHLHGYPPIPLWYDMILILSFAWTGFFLGYLSLYLMQEVIAHWFGRAFGWCFVVGMIVLTGFGIYVGRFLRWNSWDVLVKPSMLINEIQPGLADPLSHLRAIIFSGLIALFFLWSYCIVFALTHLHGRRSTP